jgi:hypothetical protein
MPHARSIALVFSKTLKVTQSTRPRTKNASRFRKNQKTVSDGRKLFAGDNYLFSTKADGREETLYFENRATNQTGRLRQQHKDDPLPLAKIDRVPRAHLFLSEKRYKYLKRWYKHERKRNRRRIPKVRPCERCRTEGKYHIEFAFKGKRLLKWHRSEGMVKIRNNPKRLVRNALNKVCGK